MTNRIVTVSVEDLNGLRDALFVHRHLLPEPQLELPATDHELVAYALSFVTTAISLYSWAGPGSGCPVPESAPR